MKTVAHRTHLNKSCRVPGRARPGNQSALRHGGAAGVKALSKGEPFKGVLYDIESNVRAELADVGISGLIERDAVRLQVVSDCYWAAVMGAEDPDKMTAYLRVWGWLHNSTIRALVELQKAKTAQDRGINALDVLNAINQPRNDTDKPQEATE